MGELQPSWIVPEWPVPTHVRSLVTTRHGGFSTGPYASMNVGLRVQDDPETVQRNRALLRNLLPQEPKWLAQVHGVRAVDADRLDGEVEADAAVARRPGTVCAVMIADCLPVLFSTRDGSAVAAAHAGWRGLSAGVLESTVRALAAPPRDLLVWLGPGIGPRAFQVGADVRDAFVSRDGQAEAAFRSQGAGKWLCDLFLLARQRLQALGINEVYGGDLCTYSDPERFFSHRRDGISGRMAALVWLGKLRITYPTRVAPGADGC
jgi:YfiH family protein